jgi:DNA primase
MDFSEEIISQAIQILPLQMLTTTYSGWSCLCPFHQEKRPSFGISKTGLYNCFSCGESGNIYKLVKELLGESIYKVLNIENVNSFVFENSLEKEVEKDRSIFVKKPIDVKGQMFDVIEIPQALDYLYSRNISNAFMDHYKIKATMACEINTTKIYNRIIIPLIVNSETVGYEARDYTRKSKPKVLYHKGCDVSNLFDIDNLNRNDTLYLFESSMNMALTWKHISKNCTHTHGSKVTAKQKEQLKEFKDIILFVDNDNAGLSMITQLDDCLDHEFYIAIPEKEGQDPNDLNLEETLKCYENKILSIDYLINKSQIFEENTKDFWKEL